MDCLSHPEESQDKNYSKERQEIRKATRFEDKKNSLILLNKNTLNIVQVFFIKLFKLN